MPALLLRYLPHITAVVALIGAIWWYGHSRDQSGYRRAQAEMSEAVRKAEEATRAAEARAQQITEAKDREWQTERNNLQGRITDLLARPAPAIRLCKSASRGEVPSDAGRANQPDGTAGRNGQDLRVGDDIGSAALVLAGRCERDRQQLVALQAWIREQAVR